MIRPLSYRPLLLALCLSTSLTCPRIALARAAIAAPAEGKTVAHADQLWRGGDRAAALAAIPAGADGDRLRAELLDALGRVAEAVPGYREALAATRDPAARRAIELRLAIIAGVRNPERLAAFAAGRPADARRHIADIVALLGRPKAALTLADAGGSVSDRLTRAQWALAAGDWAVARTTAEQAFVAAATPDDKRYALALLIEAYRAAKDLAGALAFLDRQPANETVASARIDVLLELGRTSDAIAAIERSKQPDIRRRLTGVLDLAGDQAASEAEYRRLIAAEPHQADGYIRLATVYLTRGDEAQALATFAALFAANRGRADVQTAGAQAMIAMGLQDQAVAMLSTSAGDPAVATATHLFLFETWLDRGDIAKALAELQAVQKGDARGLLLDDVVDGYERLGRPAEALALLRRREGEGRPLSYDTRVRLAQLAAETGDDADALARWRALWADTSLPARRSYIERQIVALARATNQLEPIARDLSARLDTGTSRPGEIDLLVALRLAQEHPDAAADAVRRFAASSGTGEVGALNRLAQLYARVRDYPQLESTLRRLVAVDPGQRDAHVRQLILTLLRHDDAAASPAARQADLDALMAQLSDTGDGDARAFKATVYAQAELDPQALDQLRQALAARPGDPDALSRLATELTRQRRRGEAIGLLQYAAERAGSLPVFLSAIDGLIDMAAGAAADEPGADGVLDWTKRHILERIAVDGATPRLLGLLADVAAADADHDLQIRATEAQVAAAGEQRGYVLRELVTLSGGGTAEGSAAVIGDPARKLVYARRLLALGKSFPPDLYVDLARTLLLRGDEAGAERAFAMMSGLGGLVNVDAAKGDAYAAAGLPAKALTNYARALLQDQADYDLLVKTSILYERAGQDALARRWYWRGLRALLSRQPVRPLAAGDERSIDVRRYYPTMVEGLLLSWSGDAATTPILTDLAQRFAAEVATIDPARAGALADHPRLALLVDLGHRIVDAQKAHGAAGEALRGWDATLDRLFAGDAAYRRAAALRRHLTGTGGEVVGAPPPPWAIPALDVQTQDLDNIRLRFVLALSDGDTATARAILAAALADEEAARDTAARVAPTGIRQPIYILLLVDAMDRLPADRFRDLVMTPLAASKAREGILFDIFRAAPDRYDRLRTLAGAPLLAPDTLVQLTITQSNRPLGVSLRTSWRGGGGNGSGGPEWLDHFSPDQLLALYDGLVTRLARGEGDSTLSDLALGALLRRPLDAAQQARLAAILAADIAVVRDPKTRSGGPLDSRLLQFDAAPANRVVLLQAARSVADRYADSVALPAVLERWYADDKRQAFVQLSALAEAVRARGQSTSWFDAAVSRHFPDVRRQQIEAFLADPHPDPKAAAGAYRHFAIDDPETTTDQRLALTRKMIALDPANPLYAGRLLALYAEKQDWAALAPALQAYVAAHRDDDTAATMLAIVYRLLDRPDQATAVATAAGVDPDDADWLVHLLNRSRALRSRSGGGGVAGLFDGVYDAYLRHDPTRAAVIAVEARQGRSARPSVAGDDSTLAPLIDAAKADPASVPHVLRVLWRDSAPAGGEGDTGRGRRALVYTLAAAIRGHGAGADLLARPDVSRELSSYPAVMAPEERAQQTALYDIVAYGTARRGEGAAAVQTMLADLRTAAGDSDAIYRLIALADRTEAALSPSDLAALDARLRAMPVASADGRITMARLYARSGDAADAQALLEAAFYQLLYPAGPLDAAETLTAATQRMVDTLALLPDVAARQRAYAALETILEARRRGPGGGDLPPLPPLGKAPMAAERQGRE